MVIYQFYSKSNRICVYFVIYRGGGQRAMFDLSFRHATTKTWEYFRMFGFFRKKYTLPGPNHSLKIQWEIHFFTFEIIHRNSSKKIKKIKIWTLSFQICFRNQFLSLGSGQTRNTQIRVFAYFQFDHFPKSKIDSESRFEMRMYIFLF